MWESGVTDTKPREGSDDYLFGGFERLLIEFSRLDLDRDEFAVVPFKQQIFYVLAVDRRQWASTASSCSDFRAL